jgi:SNF2 family DNA or RNA helicase
MRRYGNERAVRYDGSVGSAERERAKASFMDAASPVQIFVSNAQAGGAGLNLAGLADTVVYFSNSFSSLDRWQSEDRTHRIGTRGTVNYYDLVCRGTIDTAILANLRRKRDITDMSLTELRSLIEGSDD